MEPQYILSESLLRALHDYLLTRPMREVESLVTALRNADKHESKE